MGANMAFKSPRLSGEPSDIVNVRLNHSALNNDRRQVMRNTDIVDVFGVAQSRHFSPE
jgi:hypothetical protein